MILPSVVAVFPLTGCILLPGNRLPLHIFEPRYRNLVSDALQADRYIGMIQPLVPRNDNVAPVEPVHDSPELYRVGGLGRMERCVRETDGRYEVLLKGIVRFRTLEELPSLHEYRRFRVSCQEFAVDLEEDQHMLDTSRLFGILARFTGSHGLAIDPSAFAELPATEVINTLAAALPFSPAEKQALLEAEDARERERRLLLLLDMERDGFFADGRPGPTAH
jgi:Lon protease-like protein